ncbi:MAG: pyrroloquinoline quinone biosynthesis peptide chaperone PqqD [Reyranellales bacterium]|jgi:pyrroloquinoline quinone biosynthesis protein D
MTGARLMVAGASVLTLAPHIVFRFDETRQRWIMMAPERLMLPDEQAVEILKLVDGKASVDGIVEALAAKFNAPREEIAGDVAEMLQDLADKGCLSHADQ